MSPPAGNSLAERLLDRDDGLDDDEPKYQTEDTNSSFHSAEGAGRRIELGAEDPISPYELADLTRNDGDMKMLQSMGGVEGVAAIIALTIHREMEHREGEDHKTQHGGIGHVGSTSSAMLLSNGARVADATGMPRNTEETRRRMFGGNVTRPHDAAPTCGFWRLFFGCLCDDPMVVLFAAAVVAIMLGLVQCIPMYIDIQHGDIHLRRCPAKPLWTMSEPIPLPLPARFEGGGKCRAWMEGLVLLLMGLVFATVKAAGEWWRQKRLFDMLDWSRTAAQATVIRQGLNMRVLFDEVLVGDIVVVTAGDMVPADGVLVESLGLKVDEISSGTQACVLVGGDDAQEDCQVRTKDAFESPFLTAGSLVLEGEAMFLVTAVGAYSNWSSMDAEGLGTKMVSKLGGVVPLRRPLERLARFTTRFGLGVVYVCIVLRALAFGMRMLTHTCFDVVVEKCLYGDAGLMNRTMCHQEGYSWAAHASRLSSADSWEATEAVMSVSAMLLLLMPHGLTAVISAFTVSSLTEARCESLVLQSMKALEVMGRVSTMCIDKNSFLSSGAKRLAMAHICGVPFNGFNDEPDTTDDATENSHGSIPWSGLGEDPNTEPNSIESAAGDVFTFSTPPESSTNSADVGSRVTPTSLAREFAAMAYAGLAQMENAGLSEMPSPRGIPRATRVPSQVQAHRTSSMILWAADSWLDTHLSPTVAQILCEGFIFNTRTCTRTPFSGSKPTLMQFDKKPEDHSIDAAVHAALETLGCDCDAVFRLRRQSVLRKWPFSKNMKRASALLSNENGTGKFYASGAAKGILERCSSLLLPDGKVIPLSEDQRLALDHVVFSLPNISLNGIALAYRPISKPKVFGLNAPTTSGDDEDPVQLHSWLGNLDEHQQLLATDMVFVGILAFKNELLGELPEAVKLCEALGVKMSIVTGEAMEGGKAAALACGLLPDGAVALNASEWNALNQEEQEKIAPAVRLLAEATPNDKASLVRCLKASGLSSLYCQHLSVLPSTNTLTSTKCIQVRWWAHALTVLRTNLCARQPT